MLAKHHHVSIKVRSSEVSREFYESVLGYRIVRQHDLPGGGKILHLAQTGDGGPILEIIQDGSTYDPPNDSVHLGFQCSEIADFLALLKRHDRSVDSGPLKVRDETIIFIRDPDGYLIELNDRL